MRRIYFQTIFLINGIFLFSCSQKQEQERPNTFAPTVVETKGYVVPKDSVSEPKVIPAGQPTIVKAGNPKVVPLNMNIFPSGVPKTKIAGIPTICTPGEDTFLMPKIIPVIATRIIAGIPKNIIAKDAHSKDQNPQNFSCFGKLQGLNSEIITKFLEDNIGNIWFCTYGGGISKYDGKSFTNFTKKEGLKNDIVECILQDKNGNLWFGGFGGVNKYDGKSFTHFTDKEGITECAVGSILEDKKGNIWLSTLYTGVIKYDGKSYTNYTQKQGLVNDAVISMLEDKNGDLWFATFDGVSRFDGKSFSNFTNKEGLLGNYVTSILEDKTGNLWFGTQNGISKYDGKSFTEFTEKEGLISNNVSAMMQGENGNFWFCTFGGGVSKYDGKTFMNFTEKEGLSDNTVWSCFEDKSGNIWFGTQAGATKYNGNLFTNFTEKEGLSDNSIMSILEDKTGNLWFCSSDGGVSKLDGKSLTCFTKKEGLPTNAFTSILEDKGGNIWCGSYFGVDKYDGKSFTHFGPNQGLCNTPVRIMYEDKNGNIWFGTSGDGVIKYDGKFFTHFSEKEGLSGSFILSILEDKSGNMWFGTDEGGLTKYDGKSFTWFREQEGLGSNTVTSILEDENGNVWFGTLGGGVSKYDGRSFTNFTDKEGLQNNNIASMLEDKKGNLWFLTGFGLSKLTSKNKEELFFFSNNNFSAKGIEAKVFFKNYSYEDGFLGIGGYRGKTICETEDGTIWIGTSGDILTAYHPDGDMEDNVAPNIQLTNINLFNENIEWANLERSKDTSLVLGNGVTVANFEFDSISRWYSIPKNLSLSYNNNYLTFNFIGVTQKSPKKVKYQYKLEGIDENWSAITNSTEAPYGNLPHGVYTFKVKAMNSESYWSNEFNYTFTIRPPWWKTWWFRTLVGLSIIASIWFYIKSREKKLVAEKEILEKTVEERTEELVQKNIIVEQQKHLVEEKHREITDSINYAERIQRSFLATKELLDNNLMDHFVFFQPKDVVSGDFYWAAKLSNGNFALATADSTGHGVPGAIMSILNISCLEKSVEEEKLTEPNEILNYTRLKIIERLKKDGTTDGGKDGMDCSLISFDFENSKLTYAAANNPIWIVRENQLLEFASDKMPVGKHDKDTTPFTQHIVNLQKDDVVYALTDGMPDQFGGPKGKKFMYKQLKELLIKISHLPMIEQHETLKSSLNDWKGNLEQVDDICLTGVRV